MSTSAIIVAAGQGQRFGGETPKQFALLGGKPVLVWTLRQFETCPEIDEVVIVVHQDWLQQVKADILAHEQFQKVSRVVPGGVERQDSVSAGLSSLSASVEYVAVHDAARPCVRAEAISRVVLAGRAYGAATLAVAINDTVKRVREQVVCETLDRSSLWAVQTPQVFKYDLLIQAYRAASKDHVYLTDDSALVERLDYPVRIVEGDSDNFKLTVPGDIKRAESILIPG